MTKAADPDRRELIEVLHKLHDGSLTAVPDEPVSEWQMGCMSGELGYTISNGWRIEVFIDCGDFDFIDRAVKPDGTVVDPLYEDDIEKPWLELAAMRGYRGYFHDPKERFRVWGFR